MRRQGAPQGQGPEAVGVQELLEYGRLKDAREPGALACWADYEKHGDQEILNKNIMFVLAQSKQDGANGSGAALGGQQGQQSRSGGGQFSTNDPSSKLRGLLNMGGGGNAGVSTGNAPVPPALNINIGPAEGKFGNGPSTPNRGNANVGVVGSPVGRKPPSPSARNEGGAMPGPPPGLGNNSNNSGSGNDSGEKQVSLRLKGLFLYTSDILFHVEWCIRQLWCYPVKLYNTTSIS